MPIKIRPLFALLFAAVCLHGAAGVSAQETPDSDLILILDASNSMWGQVDGVNKIVIARESVGNLIDSLPENQRIGLIAYGHRRESDCADIEILSEPLTIDKAALKETINAINPRGQTPITGSVNTAFIMARNREASTIVLVSDGLENCSRDPCSAVRAAKEEGVPFLLHVVGFDVANEDTSSLECMAQAGEGSFFEANDSTQLADALKTAYAKPIVPEGRLAIKTTADGELIDAVVIVNDPDTGERIDGGRTYVGIETNPRLIPLDDGNYDVVVQAVGISGAPQRQFEIEIKDGDRIERELDFSAGEISVRVTRNGVLSDATVRILPAGERTQIAAGRTYTAETTNPRVRNVAANNYDVVVRSVEIKNADEVRFENVSVNSGERTELSHDFSSGVLRVGARRGEELVDSVVNAVQADGTNVGGGRTYNSDSSNPIDLTLAPGDYTVRISIVRGEKREFPATVIAGETTELLIDLDQQ